MQTGVEGTALQNILPPKTKGGDEESDEESTLVCDGGGPMALQVKMDIQQSIAGDMPPETKHRKQAIHLPEWEDWRKAEEVEMHGMVEDCVYEVAQRKDKLVVGTKTIYKENVRQDGEVETYKCRLVS